MSLIQQGHAQVTEGQSADGKEPGVKRWCGTAASAVALVLSSSLFCLVACLLGRCARCVPVKVLPAITSNWNVRR